MGAHPRQPSDASSVRLPFSMAHSLPLGFYSANLQLACLPAAHNIPAVVTPAIQHCPDGFLDFHPFSLLDVSPTALLAMTQQFI